MTNELLAVLLPIILQYGPTAVKDLIALVEGNPQKQGEADADYIARMGAVIDANTSSIDAQDTAIQS